MERHTGVALVRRKKTHEHLKQPSHARKEPTLPLDQSLHFSPEPSVLTSAAILGNPSRVSYSSLQSSSIDLFTLLNTPTTLSPFRQTCLPIKYDGFKLSPPAHILSYDLSYPTAAIASHCGDVSCRCDLPGRHDASSERIHYHLCLQSGHASRLKDGLKAHHIYTLAPHLTHQLPLQDWKVLTLVSASVETGKSLTHNPSRALPSQPI